MKLFFQICTSKKTFFFLIKIFKNNLKKVLTYVEVFDIIYKRHSSGAKI